MVKGVIWNHTERFQAKLRIPLNILMIYMLWWSTGIFCTWYYEQSDAVAVCITINNKTSTVDSVYVPPSETRNELAFYRMINSLSPRCFILGDFNGHNNLWGTNQENERGKVAENLIDSHNLILLNDSVHTRFDTYTQTSSLLDISLCHLSAYIDVAFQVYWDRLVKNLKGVNETLITDRMETATTFSAAIEKLSSSENYYKGSNLSIHELKTKDQL